VELNAMTAPESSRTKPDVAGEDIGPAGEGSPPWFESRMTCTVGSGVWRRSWLTGG